MHNIKNLITKEDNESDKNFVNRRKRINKIKALIILIGLILLVLPNILCIVLGIQLNNLQKDLKYILELHNEMVIEYEEPEEANYAYAAEKREVSDEKIENKSFEKPTVTVKAVEATPTVPLKKEEITPTVTPEPIATPTAIPMVEEITPMVTPEAEEASENTSEPVTVTPTATPVTGKDRKAAKEKATVTPTTKPTKVKSSKTSAVLKQEETSDEKSPVTGKYSDRTVYLTFDDGPSIYTSEILDIFADYNVKATFFVVGKTDEESLKMYKRIVDEGHTLGMHSYTHKYDKIYNSVEDFHKDFTKLRKLLYDTTGYEPTIYRFPGGSSNTVNKRGMEKFIKYLNEASIVYFDWNALNGDATGVKYTKEELIDNVLKGVEKHKTSIVLLHDSKSKRATVDSLPGLLEVLIEGGAQILPLNEDVKPIQMIKADSVK